MIIQQVVCALQFKQLIVYQLILIKSINPNVLLKDS